MFEAVGDRATQVAQQAGGGQKRVAVNQGQDYPFRHRACAAVIHSTLLRKGFLSIQFTISSTVSDSLP